MLWGNNAAQQSKTIADSQKMIQSVFFLILTSIIVDINCTKLVGYIYNATYISNRTTSIKTYKNTCNECICDGFFSNDPPLYVGLNCYKNNKTCELFPSYSIPSVIKININSTFIFLQQPPLQNKTIDFPLSGVTVAGYGDGTSGTALNALGGPWGLALDRNGSLYVAEFDNARVVKIPTGSLNGSIVAGTGVMGSSTTQLRFPVEVAVDVNSNVYVNDDFNYRVMLWRKNSTSGLLVAGTGSNGTTSNKIGESVGLAVDSHGNIYVSDKGNHRVMKWAPNATNGTLIAGTGFAGNSSQELRYPYGLYVDEDNSSLYIVDLANHRIQLYRLGVGRNGTTVAGGNGPGSGSHQLNQPYGVCVSKKTGDIYIADRTNHRIQRWSLGATSGVTITGITGISGTNVTMLNGPANVLLDKNETYLYVADRDNNRVQRFKLP